MLQTKLMQEHQQQDGEEQHRFHPIELQIPSVPPLILCASPSTTIMPEILCCCCCSTQAPAILFVDEFDALGAARGAQSSGDESAAIINELLVSAGLIVAFVSADTF